MTYIFYNKKFKRGKQIRHRGSKLVMVSPQASTEILRKVETLSSVTIRLHDQIPDDRRCRFAQNYFLTVAIFDTKNLSLSVQQNMERISASHLKLRSR